MLKQILRDIWNVRELRRDRDNLAGECIASRSNAADWVQYATRGEDRYSEALAALREVATEATNAYPYRPGEFRDMVATVSDAVKSAYAIIGENTGWESGAGRLIAFDWNEKRKAKLEAIIRQNATVDIIGNRPTNRCHPKTWGKRPGIAILWSMYESN